MRIWFSDLKLEHIVNRGANTLVEHLGQGIDHPEVLTIPETGYLKGVVLRAEG